MFARVARRIAIENRVARAYDVRTIAMSKLQYVSRES